MNIPSFVGMDAWGGGNVQGLPWEGISAIKSGGLVWQQRPLFCSLVCRVFMQGI
jgi:hypothetical protein